MKRIISILLSVVLLLSSVNLMVFFADAADAPKITVTATDAKPGEVVTVTIALENNPGLSALSLTLGFDSDTFTLVTKPDDKKYKNPKNNAAMFSSLAAAKNLVFDAAEDVWDDGTLCTIEYLVSETATGGDYDFTIKVNEAKNSTFEELKSQFTTVKGTSKITVPAVSVTGISVDPTSTSVNAGATVMITPTVTPSNATNKAVTWSSSDTTVATVSEGIVTGVKKGTATITATTVDGSKQASCSVTVNCVHANTTPHSAVSSTCLVQGNGEYTTCDDCGAVVFGSDDKSPLADHNYGSWIAEVAASHTANGTLGHYHCSVCGKDFDESKAELSSLVISNSNHGAASSWSSDATNHWHACKVSGCTTVMDTASHDFEWKIDTAATEDATGVKHEECKVCGYKRSEGTVINKLDHVHTGITHHDAVTANCHAQGNVEYWTCSSPKCADKYYSDNQCQNEITTGITTSINTANHDGSTTLINVVNPTCHSDGYTGDTKCLGCGNIISNGTANTNRPAHTPASSWTTDGTYHWKVCTVSECSAVIESTKAEHHFDWKVDTAATEDAAGVKHEECETCGLKRNENTPISKLDHVHTGITHHDAVAATCASKGNVEYWTCSSPKCSGKYYGDSQCQITLEKIDTDKDSTNHVGGTTVVGASKATCKVKGYTGDTKCLGCTNIITYGEDIPLLAHDVEWTVTKQPTTTEAGTRSGICKICNDPFTDEIAKLTSEPVKEENTEYKGMEKAPTLTPQGESALPGDVIFKAEQKQPENLSAEEKAEVDKTAENAKNNVSSILGGNVKAEKVDVLAVLDLGLYLRENGCNDQKYQFTGNANVTVQKPAGLNGAKNARFLISLPNGTLAVLEYKDNGDGTITFDANALNNKIVLVDFPVVKSAQTGDTSITFTVIVMIVSALGIAYIAVSSKKRSYNK